MQTEDLIPDNLPYGERQKLVSSRRAAGLPVSVGTGGPPPAAGTPTRAGAPGLPSPPPAQAFRSDFDPLREATPDMFPGLGGGPVGDPVPEQSFVAQLADTASSALVREVAARLAGRKPEGRQ